MNRAQLLSALQHLVTMDRANTAELIRIMERVDADKLFAKEGYASMFAFCVERYRMSEAQANKRIRVARLVRRFPAVIQMIHCGELHLGGLLAVSNLLTEQNHESVLARAKGLTIRQTERLASELRPLPDVPTRIRALPRPRENRTSSNYTSQSSVPRPPTASEPLLRDPFPPRKRAKDPEPLSPERFKLTMTISKEATGTLEQLQALMSHELPNGDPAAIVEKALAHLLKQKLKEKAAQIERPRECKPTESETRSRAIPASVKRAVWERDEACCSFVSRTGHACRSKRQLEFNHRVPFAKGGRHSVDNIELRCRTHNQLQADQDYGLPFMNRKRGTSVGESTASYGGPARPQVTTWRVFDMSVPSLPFSVPSVRCDRARSAAGAEPADPSEARSAASNSLSKHPSVRRAEAAFSHLSPFPPFSLRRFTDIEAPKAHPELPRKAEEPREIERPDHTTQLGSPPQPAPVIPQAQLPESL